jgi:hypothetical protein
MTPVSKEIKKNYHQRKNLLKPSLSALGVPCSGIQKMDSHDVGYLTLDLSTENSFFSILDAVNRCSYYVIGVSGEYLSTLISPKQTYKPCA